MAERLTDEQVKGIIGQVDNRIIHVLTQIKDEHAVLARPDLRPWWRRVTPLVSSNERSQRIGEISNLSHQVSALGSFKSGLEVALGSTPNLKVNGMVHGFMVSANKINSLKEENDNG
jgi:hypothetical protein